MIDRIALLRERAAALRMAGRLRRLPRKRPEKRVHTTMSRQQAWQLRKKAEGCCVQCGLSRGADDTKNHCRPCADRGNTRKRKLAVQKVVDTVESRAHRRGVEMASTRGDRDGTHRSP